MRWFFFFLIKQACSLLSVKHELTARAYLCSTTIFHRWWCADTLCLYQNKLQRSDLGLAPDWLFSTTLYTATSCRLFIVMVMGSWPGLIRNTHSHQRQLSVCVCGGKQLSRVQAVAYWLWLNPQPHLHPDKQDLKSLRVLHARFFLYW